MKELKYYYDEENEILSAYHRETDFFAQYFPQKGHWEMSKISFVEFRHSYNYKWISEEEASEISNGVVPDALFEEYIRMIKSNATPF